MQTRVMANTDWEAEDGDDFEAERVATVEDGFERGAAFCGLWICVRSQQFRSGRVTAVLSGVTVDLREAALGPEGATIHVQSAGSGIDILVPPDWQVVCDVDAICGAVGEQRGSVGPAGTGPRLRIAGMVVAGGLSVR
jgi:predicted membrane protein